MRKAFLFIFTLMITVTFVVSAAAPSLATEPTKIYVSQTGNDTNTGLIEEDAVQTIAKALSLVTSGSTVYEIMVSPGNYPAPGKVIGLPAGAQLTVMSHNTSSNNDVVIYKDPNNLTDSQLFFFNGSGFAHVGFKNLTLTGDNPETSEIEFNGEALRVYDCDRPNNILLVDNCIIENVDSGIFQEYTETIGVDVRNSSITAPRPIHMDYGREVKVIQSDLTLVNADYWHAAINTNGQMNVIVTDNVITGDNGKGRGIYEDAYTGTISGNIFTELDIALELNDVRNLVVDNNVAKTKTGFEVETYYADADIRVRGNTIISNTPKSRTGNPSYVGLYLYSNSNTTTATYIVTNNKIANFGFGIDYREHVSTAALTLDFRNNLYRGNIINISASKYSTTAKMPTAGSDWGTIDFSEIAKRIYTGGQTLTDIIELDSIFTTNISETVYVDDDFTMDILDYQGADPVNFSSIAEALCFVAPGGTVEVAEGLYPTPLWIDRDVTLSGTGEAAIDGPIDSYWQNEIIFITAPDVTLEGLTIKGGTYGIQLGNSGGYYSSYPIAFKVLDCAFVDQDYLSIYWSLYGDPTIIPGDIILEGNTFFRTSDRDPSSCAIYLESVSNNVKVLNNTLSGSYIGSLYIYTSGDIFIEDNAFEVRKSAFETSVYLAPANNLLVKNNKITSVGYNPGYFSTGLYINTYNIQTSGSKAILQTSNNEISGFNYGINLNGTETADLFDIIVGGSSANTNNFSNNQYGLISQLFNFADEPTNATYNIWGVAEENLPAYIQDSSHGSYYGPVNYLPFVIPNPKLSGIAVSNGSLTPAFDGDVLDYTVSVAHTVNSITITASAPSGDIFINGQKLTSAEISLQVGENEVLIRVEKGGYSTTYRLSISRATAPVGNGGSSYTPPAIVVTTEKTNGTTRTKTVVQATATTGKAIVNISSEVVNSLVQKAVSAGGTTKNDMIEVAVNTTNDLKQLEVNIHQTELKKIVADTDASLAITAPLINIIFDNKALEYISGKEDGNMVVISAGIVDKATLSEKDRAKVADRPLYDLSVKSGNTVISHFGGGHATVSVPYTLKPDENPHAVVIYYLAEDGSLKTIRGQYDAMTKSAIFKTSHFSKFIIAYNPVSFSDISNTAWYKDAIDFIAARGIAVGTSANKYDPEAKLTRGQFVVMLLNAYQISPDRKVEFYNVKEFSDAGNTYYSDYLLVAKGLGIVQGYEGNIFAPDRQITRQEMFVMLYNAMKVIDEMPPATIEKDLDSFDDATRVATWAREATAELINAGIVTGSNNRVDPTGITNRAQLAQVLFVLLKRY